MIYKEIQTAYLTYLRHLNVGGVRPEIPPYEKSVTEGAWIYSSSLLGCPLQNARKYAGAAMSHPPTPSEEMSDFHLMQQGVRDAEPMQEALMWYFGASSEVRISSESLRLRGRMDVDMMVGGVRHIVEIKRRDEFMGQITPKLSDLYQSLSYMMMTGAQHAHVLILNRYFFKLWSLYPDGKGFIVKDEAGEEWRDKHNTPEHLNFEAVEAEVKRQMAFIERVHAGEIVPPPISDPINNEEGWRCLKHHDKPRVLKTKENPEGSSSRRCYWFCHTAPSSAGPFRVTIADDGVKTLHLPATF